ncbi:metallophosphoesterase family protein [Dyadobacter sediminis]|uniref:Metallophosphoesterase n=1 Tax=Dyadobacter sediminis TaxID=1493691 RepID=A0A5R9KJ53_9BACT|nr:metallophosphoesterase [Dyadobacter sediminis]TLU96149.1 metallophosphoesterase [Dyadobacter sediminis]GGB79707.1 phosphoesterase [Dyadobacter sediminis]
MLDVSYPNHLKKISVYAILVTAIASFSCNGIFQYNPNQVIFRDNEKNLTAKNIESIRSIPPEDTVRFILMGDTQRWYDEAEYFVKSANSQKNISFVLHAGDISDFGLSQEFKWVNEIMSGLKYPYLTVIGNHDIVANGSASYRKMFGALNYSFEYGNNKFIFINTNSREYAFDGSIPDLNWLRAELRNNPENKNAIVVAHVPPFDGDFDRNLELSYSRMLAEDPNVKFSLYGHQHSFRNEEYYKDGVQYILSTAMVKRGYFVITTWNGGYKAEQIEY